jgi:3'-phosphoadenosine 5'-phosphosulfate sulfotransferase
VFFRNRRKDTGDDLNRKVEKFRRRWQERVSHLGGNRSDRLTEDGFERKASDSSFVYYEES